MKNKRRTNEEQMKNKQRTNEEQMKNKRKTNVEQTTLLNALVNERVINDIKNLACPAQIKAS